MIIKQAMIFLKDFIIWAICTILKSLQVLYNQNKQRMSIVQKFFLNKPILLRKILKPQNVINEIAPSLFENLKESSKQFIKGVSNKDTQYIKQVTAKALGLRLEQQLNGEFKNTNFQQQFHLSKYHFDSSEHFQISPYVIFGQDFKSRMEDPQLWNLLRPISSNRFIKFNPGLTFMQRFKTYGQKQIFGFNCLYYPLRVNVSDSQRAIDHPFMVTFQTDSTQIDPYIVDCQGALFDDWRAAGYN